MEEIILSEQQQQIFDSLIRSCEKIEGDLKTTVSPNHPQEIQNQLETLRPYYSDVPKMLSQATSLYDCAKLQCANAIFKEVDILNAKQNIQKMWIDGQIRKYNKLFIRVESVTKKLDKSIDTLVSLLSFEKEKIKHNIHQT